MQTLTGVAASAGIGIGTVMFVDEPSLEFSEHKVDDVAKERDRLRSAIDVFKEKTAKAVEDMRTRVGDAEAAILEGHALMISDPYMVGEIENLIEAGTCAESALDQVCEMFATMFESTDDELTQQRATDVRDTKSGVLAELLGVQVADISQAPENTVLVTHDLTPSMVAEIDKTKVVGVITEVGGITSHSAILARALELPAVLSVSNACVELEDGDQVIVDGSEGSVVVDPTVDAVNEYQLKQEAYAVEREALKLFIGKPTVTGDDQTVELFGNIGTPEEANQVVAQDGEGIGLFRTEFLFMDSTSMPSENEQFEAYKKAALIMKGKPVIIRTLDIGGDKEIPYLGLEKEENPFLGFRAVRFCLAREDVYRTQLRALLRASAFGDIRIMIPLVTGVEEVRAVRDLMKRYAAEFDREGVSYNPDCKLGVMIETPAAALIADLLAEEVDFFSIGTNDLTGYTMAVDRGNDKVRYLYSTYHPAVLRSIKSVISAAHAAGIPAGMCGEAAADPLLIPLWVSFGLDEYSVSATSILSARKCLSSWTKVDADALAEKAMAQKTADDVYTLLKEAIK